MGASGFLVPSNVGPRYAAATMTKLGIDPQQLRSIPSLRDLDDEQLSYLIELCQEVKASEGDALFDVGQRADACYLLTAGEVLLYRGDDEMHRLKPLALIGELGALVGQTRKTRAVVGAETELWAMASEALQDHSSNNAEVGVRLLRGALAVAADKIHRDQTRLEDMRHNLIRTQKAMKKMRDFLEESDDTVVSKPMHEMLEGLIRQNRRVNYRVEPPPMLAASLRLDDHSKSSVSQISRTHLSFNLDDGQLPQPDARISGVLWLSGPEIPVSGKVLRTIERRVDLELDLLLDEYAALLEGYLTRIQMLDFLV